MKKPLFLLLFLSTLPLLAQTRVDLASQAKSADFGLFTTTRPWRLVTALPTSCQVGEAVFVPGGLVGQQLFLCTSPDNWSPQASSSLSVAELLDFLPLRASSTTLQIGPVCSLGRPCRARFGERVYSLAGAAEVVLSGGTGSGIIYSWIDETGLRVGRSGSANLLCNAFCTTEEATMAGFPAGVLPIAAVTYTNNEIDTITGEMDHRAVVSAQRIVPGSSQNLTVTSNGATGALELDLNAHLDFGGFASTRVLRRGTAAARPASCQTGELYYQTDVSPGIYECRLQTWAGPAVLVHKHLALTGQTGNLPVQTLLAAGHEAGTYRACAVVTVSTTAASSLALPLTWRPAAGTSQTATLLTVSMGSVTQDAACRVIQSTGDLALEIDPSDAGTAVYGITATVERLQ